jgi:hypothetical protein
MVAPFGGPEALEHAIEKMTAVHELRRGLGSKERKRAGTLSQRGNKARQYIDIVWKARERGGQRP